MTRLMYQFKNVTYTSYFFLFTSGTKRVRTFIKMGQKEYVPFIKVGQKEYANNTLD